MFNLMHGCLIFSYLIAAKSDNSVLSPTASEETVGAEAAGAAAARPIYYGGTI
jgi:hypothetical protein